MRHLSHDPAERAAENLRVVENCHAYAALAQRARAGEALSPKERWQLRLLEEFLGGDPLGRRQHRRVSVLLPARLLAGEERHPGLLLDVSGGGMYLATDVQVPVGTSVKVDVEQPGTRPFVFPCVVRRKDEHGQNPGLALALAADSAGSIPS